MARRTKAELLRPYSVAVEARPSAQRDWDVSAGLVPLTLGEIARAGHAVSSDAAAAIATIADEFACARSLECYRAEPGPQNQLLKQLRDGGDVQPILRALDPVFVAEIATYLHPADAEWLKRPDGEAADAISRVRRVAARILHDYRPARGRRADRTLEAAVRALLAQLEATLGYTLQIAGNKNNDLGGPTPDCAGSRAIETLLKGIDPSLTTTTIMNMIVKVRRQPEPTVDPLQVLVDTNIIDALDSSLLPGRHAAISEIRDDPLNGFA